MTGAIEVPLIEINGTEVDALDVLYDLRVASETGAPARGDLRFDITQRPTFASQLIPGAALTVKIASSSTVLFDGEVMTVGFERRVGRDMLSVEAYDKSHRLGRTVINNVYLDQTGGDIVNDVISGAGLSLTASSCLNTTIPYFHASSTARRIIDELCRREGVEWFMLGTTLKIEPRGYNPLVTFGSNSLRNIELRASSLDHTLDATVTGWDPDTGQTLVSNATLPSTGYSQHASAMVNHVRSDTRTREPVVTTPSTRVSAELLDNEADGWLRTLDSTIVRGRGEVEVTAALVPGGQVQLDDLNDDWSGTYHVTAVEHRFGDRQTFISRFHIGPVRSDGDTDGGDATAPLGTSPIIGIVTNTGFGKDDAHRAPMVQVKYPTLDDTVQSDWMRVLTTGAGNARGFVMPHEIDDEVLVGFIGGDLSSPVVLGGLHSDDQPPPDGLEVVNSRHDAIVLSSEQNSIRIVDEGTNPGIHITVGTVTIDIDDEKVIVNGDGLPVTMKNASGSIEIDDQGAITIDGASLTVTTTQAIELKATGDAKVTGANVNVEAQVALSAKGNASATLESSGATDVKGALVNLN